MAKADWRKIDGKWVKVGRNRASRSMRRIAAPARALARLPSSFDEESHWDKRAGAYAREIARQERVYENPRHARTSGRKRSRRRRSR